MLAEFGLAKWPLSTYLAAMNSELTSFWLISALIALLGLALIWLSARKNAFIGQTRMAATDALRDAQLAELDRNVLAGQLTPEAADAMRIEIARAHGRAARRGEDTQSTPGSSKLLFGVIFSMLALAFGFYNFLGAPGYPDFGIKARDAYENPSQARALEILREEGTSPKAPELKPADKDLLDKLQKAISEQPEIAEGYHHLYVLQYNTENYSEAAIAQAKYIELQGVKTTSTDYAILADAMILSVNGYISPEAKAAVQQALKLDPSNNFAAFYMAMSLKQDGQLNEAKTVFETLKTRATDNPDWHAEIQNQITEIDGKINATKGPSAEEINNAADMSDADRQQMIGNMVDGLKERLGSSGGSPAEWAKLINALRVLNRDDEAEAILQEALTKFPDDTAIKALNK